MDFHNTPKKIEERKKMLNGEWPENSCGYCKKIEDAGGISDRTRMSAIPNLSPRQLEIDPTSTVVDPTIVEVFFGNTCQLACLYCSPSQSSAIEAENRSHGEFKSLGVELRNKKNKSQEFVPLFWKWFETGFQKTQRFHVLGGEPFLQKEFEKMLDMIEKLPNPSCELNLVTNLMLPLHKLEYHVSKFYKLLKEKKLKRIDVTCSIDCWGAEQEYVRHGLDLKNWEKNFNYLIEKKWLTININQVISVLTIKTMPDLLVKLKKWRSDRPIGHFFTGVTPGPEYMKAEIIGENFFKADTEKILRLMPEISKQDVLTKEYMSGILNAANTSARNKQQISNLMVYLQEKDRRRKTNWELVFPWLMRFKQ